VTLFSVPAEVEHSFFSYELSYVESLQKSTVLKYKLSCGNRCTYL